MLAVLQVQGCILLTVQALIVSKAIGDVSDQRSYINIGKRLVARHLEVVLSAAHPDLLVEAMLNYTSQPFPVLPQKGGVCERRNKAFKALTIVIMAIEAIRVIELLAVGIVARIVQVAVRLAGSQTERECRYQQKQKQLILFHAYIH